MTHALAPCFMLRLLEISCAKSTTFPGDPPTEDSVAALGQGSRTSDIVIELDDAKFTGNPDQFDGKNHGFRCRFSLKPIHWHSRYSKDFRIRTKLLGSFICFGTQGMNNSPFRQLLKLNPLFLFASIGCSWRYPLTFTWYSHYIQCVKSPLEPMIFPYVP